MKLGLLLPNQGVVFGATTVPELLELAATAEHSGAFDGPWVGDNLLAKPRLESVTLLSALAVRTQRCRLGTACMASFPLRDPIVLAAQWGRWTVCRAGAVFSLPVLVGDPARAILRVLSVPNMKLCKSTPASASHGWKRVSEYCANSGLKTRLHSKAVFSTSTVLPCARRRCSNHAHPSGLPTTRGCLVRRSRARAANKCSASPGWLTVG